MRKFVAFLIVTIALISCKVSYQFNGASIDYNLVKTIDIKDFQNQAATVYPLVAQTFTEIVRDHFTRNTKLSFTDNNPDLELEGEIIRFDLTPQAVKEDALASETRLTMAVRIRYRNNKNPAEDKEETITAYRDFSSSRSLDEVRDQLVEELSKDIADQIFNATMSNW
ncbi:MAG: LPS assembly lipoprotein LptE [Dysgonomonas sp.]